MTHERAVAAGRRGDEMLDRFHRQPDPDLLDRAIAEFGLSAAEAMDRYARAAALCEQGKAYRQRHTFYGRVEALDDAVAVLTTACDLLEPEYPGRVYPLAALGNALADRFDACGDPADLDEAVRVFRLAVAAMAADNPDRANVLVLLAAVLRSCYDLRSHRSYLDEAADLCREAATRLPADAREALASVHYQCSVTLHQLSRATGDATAAREAQWHARAGLAARPEHVAVALDLTAALANALQAVGLIEDDTAALVEARQVMEHAISIAPDTHARRPGFVHDLAAIQSEIYWRTGDLAVLDQAIDGIRAAVASTPRQAVDAAGVLVTLGNLLHTRHMATGAPADFDLAVAAFEAAVDGMSIGDSFRPEALMALNRVLEERCRRTDEPVERAKLLRRAVDLAREAMGLLTARDRRQSMIANNAATTFRFAYHETGDTAVLDEALGLLRGITSDPAGATDARAHRMALANLALAIGDDPRQDNPVEVEGLLRRAVATTDPADVDHRQMTVNLAVFLRGRFEATGSRAAWAEALALHHGLIRQPGTIRGLIRDIVSIAELHASVGDWRSATDAYRSAVGHLPAAARLALGPSGRAGGLSGFFALAADAAACALNSGNPELAVELLERGRGVLLRQAVEARALDRYLRGHATPEQSARVAALIARLDRDWEASSGEVAGLVAGAADTSDRVAAERELAALLDDIGYVPEAPPLGDLIARLDGARIAIVNISRHRCDALLPARGGVEVVPLDRVTWDAALRQVTTLLGSLSARSGRDATPVEPLAGRPPEAAATINHVLAWVWQAIARPVLDAYGLTGAPSDGRWPRVWWCPTGLATFLPLHAAGLHETAYGPTSRESGMATIDRVISSYALTISDLADSLADASRGRRSPVSAVAVGVSSGDLPGVDVEMSGLAARVPGLRIVRDAEATRARILSELGSADWFHFAGHGFQHPLYGRDAMLIPYDAATAGPITADDVLAAGSGSGELAYLSACDTSRGRFRLADEAAHIAGAFKAANFRHVIATAWSVRDLTAVQVTELFYDRLLRDDVDEAEALHWAVRESRRRLQRSSDPRDRLRGPLIWGTFMHFGP